jgi:ABC transporter with metal-binding/Fe-S-binding domain ATP-binding protein
MNKTGVLFSGGKDSCLALYKYGIENIDVLLNIVPENIDSWMFHAPIPGLLKKQAEMLNLPLITLQSKGEKDKELGDLKKLIEKSRIKKMIIGGIKSNYQGSRIKKICSELGVELEAPLWNYNVEKLWGELLENNFDVVITKISCEGIGKEFIGKIINWRRYEELKKLAEKFKFSLDFEGGEAETSVLYMPKFKNRIKIKYDVRSEGRYRHFLILRKIEVENEI